MKEKIPVRINNVEYPSIAAAAVALKVSYTGLANRLKAGKPGHEYVNAQKEKAETCRPVMVDGVEYPSINAAHKATGKDYRTILICCYRGDDGYRFL